MKYKIVKPKDIFEFPYWSDRMDKYNGNIVNINTSGIRTTMSGSKYFCVDGWNFNINWIKPVHSKVLNND